MTPAELTEQENEIFELLANLPEFRGRLYRDGVPCPEQYLKQRVRVLFVFREPNLGNNPIDVDMRAELRDPEFARDGKPGSVRGWWNNKVGALGHAVVYALAPTTPPESFDPPRSFKKFEEAISRGERSHASLFPFGYMQIKKVGGGGASKAAEIKKHARDYGRCLEKQVKLYKPNLIIGCGLRSGGSPARLLHEYVLPSGGERCHAAQGFAWWRYREEAARPVAMLEFNHPSFRGSREQQYCFLASAVREIATAVSPRSLD